MNSWITTSIYAVSAIILLGLAVFLTWAPSISDIFQEQGGEFYPDFKDPLSAVAIEVVTYDEERDQVQPFKVLQENGLWIIPSHHNYPADAEEKLIAAATQYIGVLKEEVRSERELDHESFGVVDPLDADIENKKGCGKRITFRGKDGRVLADYIIGKSDERKSGYSYVRIPGGRTTYSTKIETSIATKFEDWVETDLLKLESQDVEKIKINNYSFDEVRRDIKGEETLYIYKQDVDWKFDDYNNVEQEFLEDKIRDLVSTLDSLTLVNVEPKHPDIVGFLTGGQLKQTPDSMTFHTSPLSLGVMGKGFYQARRVNDGPSGDIFVLANEGELKVTTKNGTIYVLRYGDIDVSSETKEKDEADNEGADDDQGQNRFLMVDVFYDDSYLFEPVEPEMPQELKDEEARKKAADGSAIDPNSPGNEGEANPDNPPPIDEDKLAEIRTKYNNQLADWRTAQRDWQEEVKQAKDKVKKLQERFANWYYVVPNEDFKKLRLTRDQIVRVKPVVGIETLESGSGDEVEEGKTLHVLYTGWLANPDGSKGSEFDSNQDRDNPFPVENFGPSAGVIKGWQEGLKGMRVGEKRLLRIPPSLAYGEAGHGADIPPDAALIFEVTLLKVEDAK